MDDDESVDVDDGSMMDDGDDLEDDDNSTLNEFPDEDDDSMASGMVDEYDEDEEDNENDAPRKMTSRQLAMQSGGSNDLLSLPTNGMLHFRLRVKFNREL